MIRKPLLLVVFLLFALISSAQAAKPEFRAAWVTAWTDGFLTPAEADETIRMAKQANMNALMIQVRKVGDACYRSNIEPRAKIVESGYDPLAYLIEKAHKQGIEIHAWINTFRVTTRTAPSDPNHVYNLHPEWMNVKYDGSLKGEEGMYLDPGAPGAQDWINNVVMDIVKNYDVDGIHLDYIRYPGKDWGYSDIAVARFNAENDRIGKPEPGDPAWSEWRRNQVTTTVRKIYKNVKAVKPRVKVTAAVITWGKCPDSFTSTTAYGHVYQNWAAWTKEGIIDALFPMNYSHGESFNGWLKGVKRWAADRHAYTGMSLETKAETTLTEIKAARSQGLDGVCGFPFNATSRRDELVRKLREQVYQDSVPTPVMPWLEKKQ
jgi:uncharacterized lipoprotein YddW (UPF0748 family)